MFEIAGVTRICSFQEICPDFLNVSDWKTHLCAFKDYIVPPVQQFSRSLLGRIIVCTVADLKGSSYGSWAGRKIVRYGGAEIGKSFVPYCLLIPLFASATGSLYLMARKTSLSTMAFFHCAMVLSAILLFSADRTQLMAFGATAGFECGDMIGNVAGIILGGGLCLKLVGSPVTLWNKKNLSETYTFCTLKYIATGAAFDFFLASSAYPMPYALQGCRLISQTIAYNSHLFFPFVRNCIKERHLSKVNLFTSFTVQMAANKVSGLHRSSEEMLQTMEKQISIPLSIVSGMIKQAVKVGIWKDEQIMIHDTVEVCVNFAWRSLHDYVTILENSAPLKQAHNDFKRSFHHPSGKILSKEELKRKEQFKKQLIGVLDQLFPHESIYVDKIVALLDRKDIKAQTATLVEKMIEFEIEAIGFTLLKKDAEYLNQCLDIYLKYYLIFTLMNYHKLTHPLTTADEEHLILSLHRGVLLNYIKYAFPGCVVDKIGVITTYGITSLYGIKEQWSKLTQKGLKEPFDDPKCVLVAVKSLDKHPFDDDGCEAVEPLLVQPINDDDEVGDGSGQHQSENLGIVQEGRSPSSKDVCEKRPCELVREDSESENKVFVPEGQEPSENKLQLGPYDLVRELSSEDESGLVTDEPSGTFVKLSKPLQEWVS